jgi:5'-phosphate synthase pdxT subunit
MKIGVLASQGAFAEHISVLKQLGVEALPVRLPGDLAGLDGLVIPGGESTSISKLMFGDRLKEKLIDLINNGLPVLGTCAGMILLANAVSDGNQVESLCVMNIKVKRNAFGRQVDSFETELSIPVLGETPFPGVFIRAPLIEDSNSDVEIIARLDNYSVVAARQNKLLVSAFHPELTDDLRFHQYFLDIVKGER